MKFKYLTLPILFLVCFVSSAQKLSLIKGKVESDSTDVSNIHVINSSKNKAAITNSYGYFTIAAGVNDTLWFSAIQFDKSFLVIDEKVLESEWVTITLEESLVKLDEVVITPYNLSGDIHKDIKSLKIRPLTTSSTLGLPNSEVRPLSLNERRLFLAMQEQLLHRLIDEITGHNKKLRNAVFLDQIEKQIQMVRHSYPDSLYLQRLKIPSEKIDDFIYYCSIDTTFDSIVESQDKLKIWDFLKKRSFTYRKNNTLE